MPKMPITCPDFALLSITYMTCRNPIAAYKIIIPTYTSGFVTMVYFTDLAHKVDSNLRPLDLR